MTAETRKARDRMAAFLFSMWVMSAAGAAIWQGFGAGVFALGAWPLVGYIVCESAETIARAIRRAAKEAK